MNSNTEIQTPQDPSAVVRKRLGLFLGLILGAIILAAPPPASMEPAAWKVSAIAVLMATWWITEAIPLSATALLPLLLLPLLDIMPIERAAAPYANPVIFLFLGGFIIAAALQKSGLHLRIALNILRIGGIEPRRVIGAFMVTTAFLSLWVSNTATVAMMLPLALSVITVVEQQHTSTKRDLSFAPVLLLGLAYAANIGGLGTLIGSPPNALLAGFLATTWSIQISFLDWMLVGIPVVLVALPLTWLLLTQVLYRVHKDPIAGGQGILVEQLEARGRPSRTEWTVGIVTILTATAWVLRPLLAEVVPQISDAGIAIGGAVLLFIVPTHWGRYERTLTWADAERLPWGVLILFGGGLSLAAGMQESGLAAWFGTMLSGVATWPLLWVIVLVTTFVILLTELMSNTATAAMLLPVVSSLTIMMKINPLILGMPTALAATCSFMLPVATPPNAIVFGSGRLTVGAMARVGLVLNLLLVLLITAATIILVPRIIPGS